MQLGVDGAIVDVDAVVVTGRVFVGRHLGIVVDVVAVEHFCWFFAATSATSLAE